MRWSVVLGIWIGIALSTYLFYSLLTDVDELNEAKDVKRKKVILLWNTNYFQISHWGIDVGSELFVRLGCDVKNCEITQDRNITADAVMVNDHRLEEYPPVVPDRPQHQRWVYVTPESPVWLEHMKYINWNGFFNWTMTYRTDSDVPFLYGRVQPKKFIEKQEKKNWTALVQQRRPVAWMASHCPTHSKREEYVNQLQKWIEVDAYGRCGNLTCVKRKGSGDCLRMVNEKYNFYLAFENAICKDYVTEKFFKMLPLDVIPVVRGGVQYKQHCAHKWFLNTEDFSSPEQLAKELKSLLARPQQYAEFMKDRWNYDSKPVALRNDTSWCKLCAKLNDPNEPTKVYNELDKWWSPSDCHQPKDL